MIFLSKSEVINLHRLLIELHGGSHGLRDSGLLSSALAQPEASFGGEYLRATLHEKAAAYAFHLVKNHPFVDGNKRIAATAMGAFLNVNGAEAEFDQAELVAAILAVAEGRLEKAALAAWIRDRLAG